LPNRSHFNAAHRMMNKMSRDGVFHKSHVEWQKPSQTYHAVLNADVVEVLQRLPDNSAQMIICDPPYNLDISAWDRFSDYIGWAKRWLDESARILSEHGNLVIFGGFQFQQVRSGDLLEIMHYLRHNSPLRLVNLVIWYYNTGMSAHRFFANRHEEIAWYAKTDKYVFNLDEVRIEFDEQTKKLYLRDKRLRPDSVEKGNNPTNVWNIQRLSANSKERVGHPTQKPYEVISRLVKALSYPGSTVVDPFAGSGITAKVCIDENRNSIVSDTDPSLSGYLRKLLSNGSRQLDTANPRIFYDAEISILDKWKSISETEVPAKSI
jgi:site-specific DNA-methyltransferase (adenine-specific)